MADDKPKDTTIVIPLALTDFAKALRELIGAFRDLAGLAKDGTTLVRRKVAQERAADLDALGFPPGGMFRPLTRIADDRNIPQDFDQLEKLFQDSADEVEHDVQALRAYRGVIRENCGASAASRLDHLLDGPAGKFEIRYAVGVLISMYRQGSKRLALREQAIEILKMIDKFNEELIDLHDQVLPPRGAPK